MKRDRNVLFQGAIPENYDRYLGPVIFEPYAEDLVSRLQANKFERVLEIACGTGIVTRRLRDVLPATTDSSPTIPTPTCSKFRRPNSKNAKKFSCHKPTRSPLP